MRSDALSKFSAQRRLVLAEIRRLRQRSGGVMTSSLRGQIEGLGATPKGSQASAAGEFDRARFDPSQGPSIITPRRAPCWAWLESVG